VKEDKKRAAEDKDVEQKFHKLKFIIVTDLSTCWVVFNFAAFNKPGNCIYCDVGSPQERADMSKRWVTWSRTDNIQSVFGTYANSFVFCTLHCLLRVIGYFIDWVYNKVADTVQLIQLYEIMHAEVGVTFKVYTDQFDNIKVKSYNGGQCLKILRNIEKITALVDLLPLKKNEKQRPKVTAVWTEFRRIFEDIQSGIFRSPSKKEVVSKADWKERLLVWGKQYVRLHGKKDLRIYVHIVIFHAADVIEKFGPLELLNQQGFEAANSLQGNLSYHHSDHHWNTPANVRFGSDLTAFDEVIARSWMLSTHELEESAKKRTKGAASMGVAPPDPSGCGYFLMNKI
jgi:hypothetical protein